MSNERLAARQHRQHGNNAARVSILLVWWCEVADRMQPRPAPILVQPSALCSNQYKEVLSTTQKQHFSKIVTTKHNQQHCQVNHHQHLFRSSCNSAKPTTNNSSSRRRGFTVHLPPKTAAVILPQFLKTSNQYQKRKTKLSFTYL